MAYAFLAYKLATFGNYDAICEQWRNCNWFNWVVLFLVFLLLPINWAIEAKKWQVLCSGFETLSFRQSLRAVLGALTPAFITPNRIGEIVGRPMFLKSNNRMAGVAAALLNGCAQTIAIVGCGLPSLFFAQHLFSHNEVNFSTYAIVCIGTFGLLLYTYSFLPSLFRWASDKKFALKYKQSLTNIALTSKKTLYSTLLLSVLRYIVFCTQLYLMLLFFGITPNVIQAITTISLYYLFVTITPSIAASEAGIRTSYAIICFGTFSTNTVSIACAGFLLWLINFIVPMIIGSVWKN